MCNARLVTFCDHIRLQEPRTALISAAVTGKIRRARRLAKRRHSLKEALVRKAVYGLLADLKDACDGAAVLARVEAGKEKNYTLKQVVAEINFQGFWKNDRPNDFEPPLNDKFE